MALLSLDFFLPLFSWWRGSNISEITCKNEGMDEGMEKQPD